MSEKDICEEIYGETISDEEDEYISTNELIMKLEKLIEHVKNNLYDKSYKRQDINDSIEEYLPGGKQKVLPPEMISYLFTGWWINYVSKNSENIENVDNSDVKFKMDKCPLCFKNFEDNLPKE